MDAFALSWTDVALRLGLAFLAGAVIGLERENHGRAAGLRTTVLVCVAAAVAMIVSEQLFIRASLGAGATGDPTPPALLPASSPVWGSSAPASL